MDQPSEDQTNSMEEVWIKAEPIDTEATDTFYIKCEPEISIDEWSTPIATSTLEGESSELGNYDLISSESNPLQVRSNRNRKANKKFNSVECELKITQNDLLTIWQPTRFPCDECGKTFEKKSKLNRHKRCHSGEKPFACDECGMRFAQKGHIKPHKQTHSVERPFSCDECDATFKYKNNLRKHIKLHDAELTKNETPSPIDKKFSCDECEATFGYKNHLIVHQRNHSGEKPFACDECEKAFATKSHLKRHKNIHSGEKPYACDECGKRFSQKCHVKPHKLTHTNCEQPLPLVEILIK